MDVSIIIVNYNTCVLLRNCIASIFEHTEGIAFEVIVSDNGSTDGSVEMLRENYPDVILIENNENLGFGAANNRGLAAATGKYVFYLNSDTVLLNNAVKIFFDYFETCGNRLKIGALGTNLLNPDLTTGESYADVFGGTNRTYSDILKDVSLCAARAWFVFFRKMFGYKLKKIDRMACCINKTGKVGFIIGADLFLKNNAYAYFDEHYFMYFEETDLQYQMTKAGLSMILIEGPEIIHFGGASGDKIDYEVLDIAKFSMINMFISRIYFCRKNIAGGLRLFILKMLTLVIWLNPLVFNKTRKHIKRMMKV